MIECEKTQRFESVYRRAAGMAEGMGHQFLDIPHFIAAMLEDPQVRFLLERSGVDLLFQQLQVAEDLKGLKVGEGKRLLSPTFNAVIDRALALRGRHILGIDLTGPHEVRDPLDLDHILLGRATSWPLSVAQAFKADRERDKGLLQFGIDLTAKSSPTFARDRDIDEVLRVLSRLHGHHPILTGDSRIGKTAILHGLATRFREDRVPSSLSGRRVVVVDDVGLTAGTTLRGELEERVRCLLRTLQLYKGQVLVVFDDIQDTKIFQLFAGAVTRGEIQVIATATTSKYMQHRDILGKYFHEVRIDPPSPEQTIQILLGSRARFESHHGVRVHAATLSACVTLTSRYTPSRLQPASSLEALDAACAEKRARMGSPPKRLVEIDRRIESLQTRIEDVARSQDLGSGATSETLSRDLRRLSAEKAEIEWKLMLERSSRQGLEKAKAAGDSKKVEEALRELRGLGVQDPEALQDVVMPSDVAEVLAEWTGIPVARMGQEEQGRLRNLEGILRERVKGQEEVLSQVAAAVRLARAGLSDPRRPLASFLFMGPTGVGKTELAKALASVLFDEEDAMVRLDMSEYQERHMVARLIGSPPGYIGSEEGGQLTEAVRRKPYCVILLDEMEKAHPDVLHLLLQVLDDGRLTDSRGLVVSFRNAIVIMTSNVGAETCFLEDPERARVLRDEALRRAFKPEFLNRIDSILAFRALGREIMGDILQVQLQGIRDRLLAQRRTALHLSPTAMSWLSGLGYDPNFGARPLRRVLQERVLRVLAEGILSGEFPEDSVLEGDIIEGALRLWRSG